MKRVIVLLQCMALSSLPAHSLTLVNNFSKEATVYATFKNTTGAYRLVQKGKPLNNAALTPLISTITWTWEGNNVAPCLKVDGATLEQIKTISLVPGPSGKGQCNVDF